MQQRPLLSRVLMHTSSCHSHGVLQAGVLNKGKHGYVWEKLSFGMWTTPYPIGPDYDPDPSADIQQTRAGVSLHLPACI